MKNLDDRAGSPVDEDASITLLGAEEDAWCRRDSVLESTAALRAWLDSRNGPHADSGNPLADEEDAWTH